MKVETTEMATSALRSRDCFFFGGGGIMASNTMDFDVRGSSYRRSTGPNTIRTLKGKTDVKKKIEVTKLGRNISMDVSREMSLTSEFQTYSKSHSTHFILKPNFVETHHYGEHQ
jgi:hypothetical protein